MLPAKMRTEKMMREYEQMQHTFLPVFNENSKILILGTFPSVKSREQQFYYGHPQNRFWKVMGLLTKEQVPVTVEEKKALLLKHHIAIWDVIASCDIVGSSDSSIKNVVPADLSAVLGQAAIEHIFANGGKAKQLYEKYTYPNTGMKITGLPSTSPANAAYSLDRLMESWGELKKYL